MPDQGTSRISIRAIGFLRVQAFYVVEEKRSHASLESANLQQLAKLQNVYPQSKIHTNRKWRTCLFSDVCAFFRCL